MRRLLAGVLLAVASAGALVLGVGEYLSAPARSGALPRPRDLAVEVVSIAYPGGSAEAWFVPGRSGAGAVLLLHGLRANRTQMLGRAKFLQREGYAALLLDLPAHGESSGERITFGVSESAAVRAALAYLHRHLPDEPVAVIGVSLGAAAFVLANARPRPAAVVLESLYPTIREAVAARLEIRLGVAGRLLAAPLLWPLPLRAGIAESELDPVRQLSSLATPLAIAAGTADRHTRWAETLRLFDAAAAPKELWRFAGAAHVDLHRHSPAAYETRLRAFLGRHLRGALSDVPSTD